MLIPRCQKKWGLSYTNQEILGQSYTFCRKREPIIYLAVLKKGAIRHAHPYYAIYRKLPPPPPPPPQFSPLSLWTTLWRLVRRLLVVASYLELKPLNSRGGEGAISVPFHGPYYYRFLPKFYFVPYHISYWILGIVHRSFIAAFVFSGWPL